MENQAGETRPTPPEHTPALRPWVKPQFQQLNLKETMGLPIDRIPDIDFKSPSG
jgi:hypothetical protein